jgi:hypothetical protein
MDQVSSKRLAAEFQLLSQRLSIQVATKSCESLLAFQQN